MTVTLNEDKREDILKSINSIQKEFIQRYVKRGKKTVFANIMAKDKGIVLPEHATIEDLEMLLDEWVLEEYIDNGFVNPETKCECGRPLRYQYIVRHKGTNKKDVLGLVILNNIQGYQPQLFGILQRVSIRLTMKWTSC